MSNRIKTVILVISLLSLGLFLGNKKNKVITKKNNEVIDQSLIKKTTTQLSLSQNKSQVLNKDEIKFREKYESAAFQLADLIEKNDLDGNELNFRFSHLGREEFLRTLPEEVKLGYIKLEEVIKEYQEVIRKEDGIHEEFFNRYQTEIPSHLQNQREALKQVPLPIKVEDVVNKLVKQNELKNQDIEFILSECGKGNTDCINKSFALLLEANHALSDDQLATIKEYL